MIVKIFDTETTGLINSMSLPLNKQPKIIEFYGETLQLMPDNTFIKVDDLEFLCYPGEPIEAKVTQITGLTNEDLSGKPTIQHYWQDVVKFFENMDMAVAHNLAYDMEICNFEGKRNSEFDPIDWGDNRVCTVEATQHMFGYRMNLGALHEHLTGQILEKTHRARNDVEGLTRCFKKLWEMGEI